MNALKDNSAPFHLRASPAKPAVQPPRVHSSVPAPEVQAPPNADIPLEKNNENAGNFNFNLPILRLRLIIYILYITQYIDSKSNRMFCHNFCNLSPSGKAHAIFVANLPMNATVEQLDRVFKKFGSIKRDGIQVRSNKVCFF